MMSALLAVVLAAASVGLAQRPQLDGVLLQSYFVSVDNFAGPVMMGGMGIPFEPPMEMVQMMAERAGLPMEMMPRNPGLLAAIYTSGDARLPDGVMPDMGPPADFGTMRWDPAGFDTTIRTADQAMLIMKFTEWAKYFHNAWEGQAILFPEPMERLLSNLFIVEPRVMANFAAQNLMTESGFVHAIRMDGGERTVVDGSVVPWDQAAMLWALADLVGTMKDRDTYPNLVLPGDDEVLATLSGMMDRVFDVVMANPVVEVEKRGLTLVSLVWYAAATDDPALRASALKLVDAYASTLGRDERTAFEMAGSIRGLLEAARVTGSDSYRSEALALWSDLEALWDADASAYAPYAGAERYAYTPWRIGLVVGALGEVILQGGDEGMANAAADRYASLFRNVIMGVGTHTDVPSPGQTGIFAAAFSYDGSGWQVDDNRYSTGGSQYAANEMIWLEGTLNGRLDGYPTLP
jgi:hypothetical protein